MRRTSFNTAASNNVTQSGIFRATVVSVGSDDLLSVRIPRLGLQNIYEDIPYAGPMPAAGDVVFVGFLEGKSGSFVAFTGVAYEGNTGDPAGDITSVTAGIGISGGGTSGDVTVDFEPSELTTVTLAYDDKVVISDDSDSGEPKLVPISEVITTANGDGGEPIGHEDKSESVISFDYSTRTFTIAPVGDSYVVWCAGQKFVKTASESVVIGSSSDLYYISFDADGVLQATTTFYQWDSETPTAYIHYNSGEPAKYMLFDERHGIVLDWQTHEYLHRTRGAAIANGFEASNFDVSTQNGSTDDQAYIDIADGTFFDEDLQVDIVHSDTPTANTWEQDLQGPAQIPVFYQSGTTGWTYDAPTNFPLKYGGTPSPTYNLNSGGTWSTPEITSNNYGISWIVATNQLNYPVIAIMGQDYYTNVGDAEAVTWDSMDLTDLPVVELRVLYKVIYRQFGSNTPGAYFVEVDDYRRALSSATSTAAAVVDHGNLTGLGDDDHTQYLLVDGSRAADELTVTGDLAVDTDTLFVDATNNRVGINTTSVTAGHVLETRGAVLISSTAGVGNTHFPFTDGRFYYTADPETGGTGDHVFRHYSGGSYVEQMRILENGNVGIGDSTPSFKLDVNGTGGFMDRLFVQANGSDILTLRDTGGTDTGGYIAFEQSGGTRMGYMGFGNNDDIHIRNENSGGNMFFGVQAGWAAYFNTSRDFVPYTDNTHDLGSTSLHWAQVHAERYYTEDSDTYIEYDGDSGAGIDGPGIRFVINNSEMFKFLRENNDGNHSMLTFGENNDGILYEKDAEKFNFYRGGAAKFEIEDSVYVKTSGATYLAANPPTGTGNDAEWAAPFGIYILRRNSSLAAEKENITADLGEWLTADMIDQVVPKMWNRIHAPGYPEIGPIAEEMDAISPFLAANGTTAEGEQFLTGINKTAYLSLLVLAVKDLRSQVATLTTRLEALEAE